MDLTFIQCFEKLFAATPTPTTSNKCPSLEEKTQRAPSTQKYDRSPKNCQTEGD